MAETNRNHRVRYVYAQLKALADNLPELAFEADATAYNALVDELIELGYQAEGFKIRDQDMFRPVSSVSPGGHKTYRGSVEVRYGVFNRQVQALMTYFELVQNDSRVDIALPVQEG